MFFDIAEYLQNFSTGIITEMPDDIFSCEIYSGALNAFSENKMNFKSNSKSQLYIAFHRQDNQRKVTGQTRVDNYFAVFVVTAIDKKMADFSIKGIKDTQKIIKYIMNANNLSKKQLGTTIVTLDNIVNNLDLAKMYNIYGIYFKIDSIVEY